MLASAYVVVLLGHAAYAWRALQRGKLSLEIGPFRSRWAILAGLFGLNGISLLAFVWPNTEFVFYNVLLHGLLLTDEVRRTRQAPARWPFIVNHALFALILLLLLRSTRGA